MSVSLLPDPQNPLDDNQPLWRYTRLSTLFLLLEGTAFLPSVATLRSGDPLEGISTIEAISVVTALDDLQPPSAATEVFNWLKENAAEWQKKILSGSSNAYFDGNQVWSDLYERELAKRRAVWCWYASSIESAAMWSVYGPGGMAIHTTVGALRNALPDDRAFQMARIRYIEPGSAFHGFIPENPTNKHLLLRPHLLKRREYHSENEVRVVATCEGDEPGTIVKPIDWRTLIKGIVISPLFPYEEAKVIEKFFRDRDWSEQPRIQRSSLLGHLASQQESRAATHEIWDRTIGPGEQNIPDFMREL